MRIYMDTEFIDEKNGGQVIVVEAHAEVPDSTSWDDPASIARFLGVALAPWQQVEGLLLNRQTVSKELASIGGDALSY